MEKLNLNFDGGDNIIKSICWIFSVLSWLLLIVTGWISIRWIDFNSDRSDGKTPIVWTIFRYYFDNEDKADIISDVDDYYYPLQMHSALIYIVFILAMVFALAGFIIYMIKSTCKKEDTVYNGMMGQWSKFHFFPLLCVSALFLIGENSDNSSFTGKTDHLKNMKITGFIFTSIGLASLIFIYIMTDLNSDWYIVLTLKKGTYSCFITLMWYYFCYAIYGLRLEDKDENTDPKKHWDFLKGCSIAFAIIFGLGSLAFSFVLKT